MTEHQQIPFPPAEDEFGAGQIVVAPDGPAYVVPSGMHERLRRVIAPDESAPDPKVALALSGWVCLQADGMTDRVNVDAPDDRTEAAPIRRFARAHDAGSVSVALHPSGDVYQSNHPTSFAFEP